MKSAPWQPLRQPSAPSGFPNVLRGAQPAEVIIGHIHPLSGFLGYLGNQLKNGCELAVEEINAAGGIKSLDGAKIKLLTADSEGKPDLSIPAVEKLDREGVVAVTGCLQSSVTIVATQVAEKQRVPFVVSVAVADNVTERGFKYTFRIQPNAAQMGAQTVQYISEIAKQAGSRSRRSPICTTTQLSAHPCRSMLSTTPPNKIWKSSPGCPIPPGPPMFPAKSAKSRLPVPTWSCPPAILPIKSGRFEP